MKKIPSSASGGNAATLAYEYESAKMKAAYQRTKENHLGKASIFSRKPRRSLHRRGFGRLSSLALLNNAGGGSSSAGRRNQHGETMAVLAKAG
jgi:hypothetical protein